MKWININDRLTRKDRRRLEKLYAHDPGKVEMLKLCYDNTATDADWKRVEIDKIKPKN